MRLELNSRKTLEHLVSISRSAGLAILEWYDEDIQVTRKDDDSPLTRADLASHAVICKALEESYPGIPVLSEESATVPWETRQQWGTYWLIDPLDGTKEFINRNGEFTVNIALIDNHRPVAGVVHVPVNDLSYFGSSKESAWRQQGGEAPVAIRVRQPAATPPVIVGSRSHANPELEEQLARLGDYRLTSMGSSLKFCRLAEGNADFYPRLGPTSEWDTAAAHAVVNAAGGHVVTIDGAPLSYNRKESFLNPHFFVYGDSQVRWLEPFQQQSRSSG
jgi:3'(2'), 5'-bisphosphate nucleotidase